MCHSGLIVLDDCAPDTEKLLMASSPSRISFVGRRGWFCKRYWTYEKPGAIPASPLIA